MPYPFAHPAAVLPLIGPLGRFAAPSALVIGCLAPDFWYLLPLLERGDTHGLAGLLGFCLPAGLAAYYVFHRLLKQPLLALLPQALASKLAPLAGLPKAPWHAVALSLLIGAATHLAWDAASHVERALQHASTVLGTAYVAWWTWRRFERLPARALPRSAVLSPAARASIVAVLVLLSVGWAGCIATEDAVRLPGDVEELRHVLRTAGVAAVQALGLSTIGYAMLWKMLR